VLCGCGGGSSATSTAAARPAPAPALGQVRIVPRVGRRTTFALTAPWFISYDARGRHIERAAARAATLTLAGATGLIISSTPAALLLHRLAELHARLKPGQFPVGADTHDHLHVNSTYWTSGFWPGALWQAAALAPDHGMFERWALSATVHHFGQERHDTHDVGFEYGQSSLAAYMALCHQGRTHVALCSRLKRSVVAAADTLVRLAATNARAGTIPTNSSGPEADTIVDSMMNVAILPWATRFTGDRKYVRLAARHAHRVAQLLVRRDGSTIQAVNFDRATGRVQSFATHQGISEKSTWSRGEGWALYGFAQEAALLHDRDLLRVAERVAGYVSSHLPAGDVPRWDYNARPGAPLDVSAGAITSAGLMHLANACRQLSPPCPDAAHWISLSKSMLAGVLAHASSRPPLGLLAGQALNERAHGAWFNGGELIFGLSYALEAMALQR
jgi:unsaturated chondroitin disaccharide hydrolase